MWARHQHWNKDFSSNSFMLYDVEWCMWRVRQEPFQDVTDGLEIVYVSGGGPANGRLMYTATMDGLVAEAYESKEHAWDLMRRSIGKRRLLRGEVDHSWFRAHPYTKAAPETGWLLAWAGTPERWLDAPRPDGMRFRQNGWCEINDSLVDVLAESAAA